MALRHCAVAVAALLTIPSLVSGFYLPGAAPKDYQDGDKVLVHVNRLNPLMNAVDSKIKSMINYDYYNPSFHFCTPHEGVKRQSESLGSILFGDRIFNSPYDITMLKNETCKSLCKSPVPAEDAKFINERIREDQAINWLVDGLPAAEMKQDEKTGEVFYDIGFNLGNDEDPEFQEIPALYNHYDILIKYHTNDNKNYRIVGVLVWPRSFDNSRESTPTCSSSSSALVLSETRDNDFWYTYSVAWAPSDTPWATRWDNYLHIFDQRIHWFSLTNSIVIVVFLCFMVSMILLRTVNRDISRYNAMDLSEDVQEDFGWKLVHGEVFRTPRWPIALSVLVGNGSQLVTMFGITLVFALAGFLSPSNRGSLATVMIIFWTFSGSISGYVATRIYLSLGGQDWQRSVFFTATVLPTFIFIFMFLINLFLIGSESAGAVPFGTILVILLLWVLISVPLTIIGGIMGKRHGTISHPVRVNQIPRQIPPGPSYLKPHWASLLGGILPFGAAFVELYFTLASLFASRAYYAFGFVSLTSMVVVLTTATVSILFSYFILCAEEYRWQWRSFLVGGGSAAWLFLYGIYYWATQLRLDSFSSTVVYFGYLFLLTVLNFLCTASIGFIASYWAVRRLYSAIRID
ncbi:endosomal P24A protein [Clavulina sp. PMI_390]|nr:endosomal P24A protein [Clavulina sp. PMI_390]